MQTHTAQQSLQFVDLSVAVDANHWEPDVMRCEYIDHQRGADLLGSALIHSRGRNSRRAKVREWLKHKLGLGVDHRDFPNGKGLSLMRYTRLPWPLYALGRTLPATHMVELMRGVVLRGATLGELLPNAGGGPGA
jgi:hypothetical protein